MILRADSRTVLARTQYSLITPLVTSLVLFAALLASICGTNDTITFGILIGVPAAWVAWHLLKWLLVWSNRIDLFSPVACFPAAYILWFGLGSVTFLLDVNPPPYLYFVLGLSTYLLGAFMSSRGIVTPHKKFESSRNAPWNAFRFRLSMLCLCTLMASSYLLLILQLGVPAIHSDVDYRRQDLGEHGYLLFLFLSSTWTLMFFGAADLWRGVQRTLSPTLTFGILATGCLMVASFGNRGFFLTPIVTLIILRHYWKGRIALGQLTAVLAIVLVVAVGYEYVRGSALKADFGDTALNDALYFDAAFMIHANLSSFRDIVQTIPSAVPYQHGALTFGPLVQAFPGHHESSDMFFKRILGNDFLGGGQPGSLLAPFYGDFGVLGILAGMLLFGALSVKVYHWMEEHPTLFRVLIYAWLAQAALLSVYGALVTYFITLWLPFLWWILLRLMKPLEKNGELNPVTVGVASHA